MKNIVQLSVWNNDEDIKILGIFLKGKSTAIDISKEYNEKDIEKILKILEEVIYILLE